MTFSYGAEEIDSLAIPNIPCNQIKPVPDLIPIIYIPKELVPLITVRAIPNIRRRTTSQGPRKRDRIPNILQLASVVTVRVQCPIPTGFVDVDNMALSDVGLCNLNSDGVDRDLDNGLVDVGLEVGPGFECEGAGPVRSEVV